MANNKQFQDFLDLMAQQQQSTPNPTPVSSFGMEYPDDKFRNLLNQLDALKAAQAQPAVVAPAPVTPEAPPIKSVGSSVPKFAPQGQAIGAAIGASEQELQPETQATSVDKSLDFTGTDLGSKENLGRAFEAQNNMNLLANAGRSFDKIGSSIARVKNEENPVYAAIERQSANAPKQYEAMVEDQKNDPNSALSTGFRDFVQKKLGIPLKGEPAASDLAQVAPLLFKDYEARLAEKGKLEGKKIELAQKQNQFDDKLAESKRWHDLLNAFHQNQVANAQSSKEVKDENRTNTDFMKMAEKLSSARASSRSAFGKAALNKAAAERIETLVAGRNLNDLDSREIQEVARSLDSLLAQGQPTISGTHELVPRTLVGKQAAIAEYLLNQRQGANAGSFLQQMIKTVGREKELANKQRNQYIQEMIPGYSHLQKKDPERFNALLDGLTNSKPLEESAPASKAAQVPSGTDEKIQQYADQHFGGDYQKAKALLESRGYKSGGQ